MLKGSDLRVRQTARKPYVKCVKTWSNINPFICIQIVYLKMIWSLFRESTGHIEEHTILHCVLYLFVQSLGFDNCDLIII